MRNTTPCRYWNPPKRLCELGLKFPTDCIGGCTAYVPAPTAPREWADSVLGDAGE
jgi:hypothetical protein